MQVSKQLVKEAGLHPKLKLLIKEEGKAPVPTGVHKVRLLRDKEIIKKDITSGKDTPYIRYLVEENGETKVYDTRKYSKETGDLSYLVQKLAEYPENSYVILEAKKQGAKNYISVQPLNTTAEVEVEDEEDDDMEDVTPEVEI